MHALKSFIVILMCLTALTTNGQYKLLKHNEPNPFDSAVAIRIDRYRLETRKLNLCDQLIDSLTNEIRAHMKVRKQMDSVAAIQQGQITALTNSNARIRGVVNDLNTKFDELFVETRKQNKLLRSPYFWFVLGMAGGVIIMK